MPPKPAFFTIKEVAAILRVSPFTVYNYALKRRTKGAGFPIVRYGQGQYRIPRAAFLKWAGLDEGDL